VLDPDGHRIEAVCHAPESPMILAESVTTHDPDVLVACLLVLGRAAAEPPSQSLGESIKLERR
jgi:hypothetical protein